ncbi:hypothetical protein A2U01_0094196, partial [Trifolium medium]|nr:hypothetical protein [Trifolium medium]
MVHDRNARPSFRSCYAAQSGSSTGTDFVAAVDVGEASQMAIG